MFELVKKLFFLLVFLSSLLGSVLACSCVDGSYNRPRSTAICDDFRYEDDVFIATVQEVYCKCLISDDKPEDFSCVKYDMDDGMRNGETQETFNCQTQDIINFYKTTYNNCSETGKIVFDQSAPSFDLTKTPVTNLTNQTNCGFAGEEYEVNGQSECALTYQPCYYMVNVTQVFKGSLNIGSLILSAGPDVLTSCGQYDRVLQIGKEYVAGVGGACNPINEWTEVSDYTSSEIDLLERASIDPQVCGSAAIVSCAITVSVLLLISLLVLAF